ncbi:MAG: winged helix-turn-helix domain-containing protein [Candidatus Diapherotrites archaeon]
MHDRSIRREGYMKEFMRDEFLIKKIREDPKAIKILKKYKGIRISREFGETLFSIVKGFDSQKKLAEHLGKSQPTISERVYLLEKADYITGHSKDLKEKYYSVNFQKLTLNCFVSLYHSELKDDHPTITISFVRKKEGYYSDNKRDGYYSDNKINLPDAPEKISLQDMVKPEYKKKSAFVEKIIELYFKTTDFSEWVQNLHMRKEFRENKTFMDIVKKIKGSTFNLENGVIKEYPGKQVDPKETKKIFEEKKVYPTISEAVQGFPFFFIQNFEAIKAMTHKKENIKILNDLRERALAQVKPIGISASFKNTYKELNL